MASASIRLRAVLYCFFFVYVLMFQNSAFLKCVFLAEILKTSLFFSKK